MTYIYLNYFTSIQQILSGLVVSVVYWAIWVVSQILISFLSMSFLSNWSDLHVHEYAQLEISSKCYIKAANSSTLCKFHERRKGLQPVWPLLVCTWRHGNHVGGQGKKKQKHFSPFGTKPYFHRKSFEKKFYCNEHQHGRFFHVAESQESGWTYRTYLHI